MMSVDVSKECITCKAKAEYLEIEGKQRAVAEGVMYAVVYDIEDKINLLKKYDLIKDKTNEYTIVTILSPY